MLQFFRKYQRVFFLIVTFVIIISFSFFGTQLNAPTKEVKDKRISQTIYGKPVTYRQVQLLSNFLDSKWDDKTNPNLFNNDVLVNDIFTPGYAEKLVAKYFDVLKEDLEQSFSKTKNYKPYVHPKHEFLCVENIWSQFFPKMKEDYNEFLKNKEFSVDTFKSLANLFINESSFPSYLLKSILLNTERKQSWIEPDRSLPHKNLALFGFKSPSEWFGKPFLELVAQFILNASSQANEKGYKVSYEEAKIDLHKNLITSLKKRKEFDEKTLASFLAYQLNRLNMTETEAVNLWSHVLSFCKYFKSISDSLILDLEIWPFKITKSSITSYQLPNYLKFSTFIDALKFDLYISAVSDKESLTDLLDLPQRYLSVDDVKKAYPELVESKFKVEFKEITADKLKSKITIKDIWRWQLKDENWAKLKDKFSFVLDMATQDARFENIKDLSVDKQNLIDDFAREEIIKENENLLVESFNTVNEKKMLIGISKERLTKNLLGIDNPNNLKSFLLNCNLETFSKPYSDNNKAYYQFKLIEGDGEDEIMTFERAVQTKSIDISLERFLEEKYPSIRKNNPARFKDSKGNFKPFNQVMDEVGLAVFQKTYDEINNRYSKYRESDQPILSFFAAARLSSYVEKAYANRDSNLSSFINKSTSSKSTLSNQWKLVKKDQDLHSSDFKEGFITSAFDIDEKKYSDIGIYENSPMFFFVNQKKSETDQEAIENKKRGISAELKDDLVQKIINDMHSKKVVSFLGD